MRWRDIARPIIARVIEEIGRENDAALRKALRDVYPFGVRAYHPYKIWLDEIKRQLGRRKIKQNVNQVRLF